MVTNGGANESDQTGNSEVHFVIVNLVTNRERAQQTLCKSGEDGPFQCSSLWHLTVLLQLIIHIGVCRVKNCECCDSEASLAGSGYLIILLPVKGVQANNLAVLS